jgi:hypothetical protein
MIILVKECLLSSTIIDPQNLQTDQYIDRSFSLLSENSFVLPRVDIAEPSYSQSNAIAHALGYLDVYHFGANGTTPSEPKRVASFALPSFRGSAHLDAGRRIRIRCAPALVIPNYQFQTSSSSKIYGMAPIDRLLYIDIRRTPMNALAEEIDRLYVASPILLDAVHRYWNKGVNHPKSSVIPWAHWAHQVLWTDSNDLHISLYGVFGQRTADFLYPTSPDYDQLVILDVNQHRLKAHDMASMHTENVLCVLGDGPSMDTHIVEGDVARSSACPPVSRRCRKTILKIGKSLDWLSEVIIDDERSKHMQTPVPNTDYSYAFCFSRDTKGECPIPVFLGICMTAQLMFPPHRNP